MASSSGNGTTPNPTSKDEEAEKAEQQRNLVGKLNNLVTTDLDNIRWGQSFMSLRQCANSSGLYIFTVFSLQYSHHLRLDSASGFCTQS